MNDNSDSGNDLRKANLCLQDLLEQALATIRKLEGRDQPQAVEPAMLNTCLSNAKQEPAQAEPVFWASENILKESLRDNISCVLTTTKCAANAVPLYTAPPAISEPAQAVPVECEQVKPFAYTSKAGLNHEKIGENYGVLPVRSCMGFGDFDHIFDQPIYLNPIIKNYSPAIDDETRRMVLELCKVVDNYTDIPLTEQIRKKLEAGNGE